MGEVGQCTKLTPQTFPEWNVWASVFEKTQIVGNIEADGVAGSGHIVLLL